MAKKARRSEFSRLIRRGRLKAGSLPKLIEALGEPRLILRTVESWEQEQHAPPAMVKAMVTARLEAYLKGKP